MSRNAIYDGYAKRKFKGIDFMQEQVPDATTLLHFRRLIEKSGLGKAFFDAMSMPYGRRTYHEGRHDNGRDAHQRTIFYQEHKWQPRLENEEDKEG